jgi:hypothetical protein
MLQVCVMPIGHCINMVTIVPKLRAGLPRVQNPTGTRDLSLLQNAQTRPALGPPSLPFSRYHQLFPWQHEAVHSHVLWLGMNGAVPSLPYMPSWNM